MFKLAGKDTNTFESLLRAIIPLQVKTDFIVEVNRHYKSLEEAEAEARVCGIGIRIAHGLVLEHVDRCIIRRGVIAPTLMRIPVGQWRDRRCATVADVPQCALATLPPAKCGAA